MLKGMRHVMEDVCQWRTLVSASKERLRDRECSVGLPTHPSLYDNNEKGKETGLTRVQQASQIIRRYEAVKDTKHPISDSTSLIHFLDTLRV